MRLREMLNTLYELTGFVELSPNEIETDDWLRLTQRNGVVYASSLRHEHPPEEVASLAQLREVLTQGVQRA